MKVKRMMFAAIVCAGVLGSAGAASADVRVSTPPNPISHALNDGLRPLAPTNGS
jgi:hypothetical protein